MKAGILIVTHEKDLPFFRVFANSYRKFATGFHRARVVVPSPSVAAFQSASGNSGIEVVGYTDLPEKSFLYHMVQKCMADHWLPDCDYIFHLDSDCVFAEPSKPEDWFQVGKPVLSYRKFSDILEERCGPDDLRSFMGCTGSRLLMNRNQYLWKNAAEFALGLPVKLETMQRMPIVHHSAVYLAMRCHIENRFKTLFETYVLGCQNEFPQTFCEFNTLGAIASEFFTQEYVWNIFTESDPLNLKVIQTWSHGGFDLPHKFPDAVGGLQTPAQLFQRLEIL